MSSSSTDLLPPHPFAGRPRAQLRSPLQRLNGPQQLSIVKGRSEDPEFSCRVPQGLPPTVQAFPTEERISKEDKRKRALSHPLEPRRANSLESPPKEASRRFTPPSHRLVNDHFQDEPKSEHRTRLAPCPSAHFQATLMTATVGNPKAP